MGKDRNFKRKAHSKQNNRDRSGKGKNDSGRFKSGKPMEDEAPDIRSKFNDFAWYNANPNLTEAAARIPFPYRPGMNVPYKNSQGYNIPGVLRMQWCPTVGRSASATDPASIAAKEIYAKVRAAYSGRLYADPPDFVIYLLALDSIFSYIGSLKRIYRILNAYSPDNYQTPDALLQAMGIVGQTLQNYRRDKVQFWQYINTLIDMTKKFHCPAVFSVFNRHYWLNDNVYTDDAMANSQFYIFQQKSVLKFTVAGEPAIGQLVPVNASWGTTPADAYEFGRTLINALADSEDAYTISGYLTRAFEGYPEFSVDQLGQFEEFIPVYVPEVLQQIENFEGIDAYRLSGSSLDTVIASTAVTQNPGTNAIISQPCAPQWTTEAHNTYLSIRSPQPNVIDVVESTRFTAYVDPLTEVQTGYNAVDCGTELPLGLSFFSTNNYVMFGKSFSFLQHNSITLTAQNYFGEMDGRFVLMAYVLSGFDWAPKMLLEVTKTGTGTDLLMNWDIHNTTSLSPSQLEQLHRICLYSEFGSFNI